jgi:putative cardiolipin synthase
VFPWSGPDDSSVGPSVDLVQTNVACRITHGRAAETALVGVVRVAYHEASKSFLLANEAHPMHPKKVRFAWVALCLACGLSGCGGLPQAARKVSHAILDNRDTALGKAAAARLGSHEGTSGAFPLADGVDAFGARIGLARAAQRTIDVQYYIFHADNSGHAFLGELLSAADRGVRVRLLLDDIHTAPLDRILATVASHPNFEVRLFNPFAHRRARWLDALTDFGRITRRMHNKSLTADNAATIVGGRNIGDEYFGAKPDLDFSDLDLLIIGALVPEVSAQFDQYWNSRLAYPVAALLTGAAPGPGSMRALRGEIARHVRAMRNAASEVDPDTNKIGQAIVEGQLPRFFWGSGMVLADPPDKILLRPRDNGGHAATRLLALLTQAREELVLVSPYFVPGTQGVELLQGLVRRGVRVVVITNSFAATDVRPVHAGYVRYREALLRAGVELYEMKPSAHTELARETRRSSLTGSSRSSLHAKAYMTDRRVAYVGSFNLDHRSARLNTEMGAVVENGRLCVMLHNDFVRKILDVAYRVELVADPRGGERRLAWTTREGGRELRFGSEPGMNAWQKLYVGVLRILPIEDQL